MAGILRLTVSTDVAELSRDLRSFGDDLDHPLRDALEYGAKTIAAAAKPLMRFRAEGAWPNSSGARYGHISDWYAARVATTSASVYSDHPAAPVWEWGGHIDPGAGGGEHKLKAELSARSRARTEYVLREADDGGTRFDYHNEFRPPLGPIGAIVSRALIGGMPEREARRTLDRLRTFLEPACD